MASAVPRSIVSKLAALRRKELSLRLLWGSARWAALAAAVFVGCCLLDWVIDLNTDTPMPLRVLLLFGQVLLWAFAAAALVIRPLTTRNDDEHLALWVEDRAPEFDHRLITAVQLNRPDAPTAGMSPELIAAATRQAEERTASMSFAGLLDAARARRAVGLILPAAGVCALLFALHPALATALIARQFLADVEIPRSTRIEALAERRIAPAGEDLTLEFRVTGRRVPESAEGWVRLWPEGRPSETYPLAFERWDRRTGEAVFAATVPAASTDFEYRARLLDGRSRRPASVAYVPRPVVKSITAAVLLPEYVGRRPDGGRYEQVQPRGDAAGPAGSAARIVAEIQKPVVSARLELLGRSAGTGASSGAGEVVLTTAPMTVSTDGMTATGEFDIVRGLTGYRILVEDRHGFANSAPPHRGVGLIPDEPPRVVLLPERYSEAGEPITADEGDLEGIPVPLGSTARIAYHARHPYGLSRAQLVYRVNTIGPDGSPREGAWLRLPLVTVQATAASGPFDVRRGAFVNTLPREQVGFHPIPSPDPARVPSGLEGGGRYDFQTRALPDLKLGDQIDFFVEVFDRNPDPDRPPGRSEVRRKTVVDAKQFQEWLSRTLQEEMRLRALEQGQRNIFSRDPNAPIDDRPDGRPTRPASATNPRTDREPEPKSLPKGRVLGGEHRFVRTWLLIGVFPNKDEKGRDTVYPPEEQKVQLDGKRYDGAVSGSVRWKPYAQDTDRIDLQRHFSLAFSDAGVAYGVCWVNSPRAQPAAILVGADDGIKVWIRRKPVLDEKGPAEAEPGSYSAQVELAAGWNEVMVKVDSRFGRWAFYFEFRAPEGGKPLEGVRVTAEPPK